MAKNLRIILRSLLVDAMRIAQNLVVALVMTSLVSLRIVMAMTVRDKTNEEGTGGGIEKSDFKNLQVM